MAPGAINRNAVSPPAQGWRFGYPGIADEQSFNAKRLRHVLNESELGATAKRLESTNSLPRVAEAATLG